jgi:hypothetical protein
MGFYRPYDDITESDGIRRTEGRTLMARTNEGHIQTAISAQRQLEAILDGIIECSRQQRGDAPPWQRFDPGQLPSIVHALALRGRELASATSSALAGEFSSNEFELTVQHG